MDVHYTPHTLASKLVASAPDLRPLVVADLCAGRGDLLLQAEAAWPQAKFAAVDIDRTSVRRLQRLRKNWHIGRCDLQNPRSRSRSSVLRHVGRRISLLLLNPPFSCRGSARLKAHTPHGYMYTSTAMYFLVTSLGYLHESGSAVAVLPHGVLHNQKDSAAWLYIQSRYSVTVVDRPRPGAFPRSSASTVIVRLSPVCHNTANPKALPTPTVRPDRVTVHLTRGCQPLYRLRPPSDGPILVHSTDLRDATVYLNGRRSAHVQRAISAPAVLIPRVGRITKNKIAMLDSSTPVVMSDCVIGLRTRSPKDAREVRKRLIDAFPVLKAQYVGTGAPFVTIRRLRAVLVSLGIDTDAT